MRLLGLIALFVLVPFAELYVILQVVGPAIGAPWTILLLAADSIIGALLFRSQGRAVWRQFSEAVSTGRIPHREVVDGILVVFGGAFLITPGFLTDVIGLLLLIPPTRAGFRRLVVRQLERRTIAAAGQYAAGRTRAARHPDFDVEGTAYDRDDVDFELPRRSGERRGGPPRR